MNNYNKSIFSVLKSRNNKKSNMALKKNVFMSYQHTLNIREYIMDEDWGKFNKRLFSYLDYTFRARLINSQIFKYRFNNGAIIGLFHTALKQRKTQKPLYLVFKLNPELGKKQEFALTKGTLHIYVHLYIYI